jgi:two-component system, cell cycle response regulator
MPTKGASCVVMALRDTAQQSALELGTSAPASDRASGAPGRAPGCPVLVVADDDEITRERLDAMFRDAGYEVKAAADGQEAIDRVACGGVDVVLLDATMPRISGLEACRLIKGMAGDAFLPVLIATVKTDPSSRVEGLSIGADDYVCKPFEEAEVLGRVSAMLRIKRAHDEMQAARVKLARVSVRDELTGLYNYRYLHTRLADEFKRAEVQHEPLACCILDIDRLKAVNDRGGRGCGDAVLRAVAEVISASVRESDVVARYGADEFLVVLPGTHFAGALAVAERIWGDVRARAWAAPCALGKISASIGVALFPSRDVRTRDMLLLAADAALVQAKREGGNRVCVFQQRGVIFAPGSGGGGTVEGAEP